MGCGSQAGEHLEFIQDAVAQALETVVVPDNGDKSQWLFQQLVDTALDVPEVCFTICASRYLNPEPSPLLRSVFGGQEESLFSLMQIGINLLLLCCRSW